MFKMQGKSRIMLNDEELVVRRQDAKLGDYVVVVDGKRVKRGHAEFAVRCNVQPVSGKDLLQVPEGDRFDEAMWFYVDDTQTPLAPNDLICRPDDGWYQVQTCEGWGSYTRAMGQLVDAGPLRLAQDLPLPNALENPALLFSDTFE